FFSSRRRHTISKRDWSSDVCSSDLTSPGDAVVVLNQVTLQKDNPTVDAVYGIDNYSAPTLLSEDILVPHGAELGDAQQYAVDSEIGRASCRERGWMAGGGGAVRGIR